MGKQYVTAGIPKHVRLPVWKRLMLATTLFLSAEPLVAIASTPAAYADSFTYITCNAGSGGNGGVASSGSNGGGGGAGGDCIIGGARGGDGGTSSGGGGSNGGNAIFRP